MEINGFNYEVRMEEYKGSPVMAIYQVDEHGKPKYERPVISFGKMKAKILVEMIEEIREFAEY